MLTKEQAIAVRAKYPEWVKLYNVGSFRVLTVTWNLVEVSKDHWMVEEQRSGKVHLSVPILNLTVQSPPRVVAESIPSNMVC